MDKSLNGDRTFVNEAIDKEGFAHSVFEDGRCEAILGELMGQFPGCSEEEMIQ